MTESSLTFAPPPEGDGASTKAAPPDGEQRIQPTQLDHLRELRAEVQDLQSCLIAVRKGQVTLAAYANYIQKTKDDIASLIADLPAGDTVRHLLNNWEQMSNNPLMINPEGEFDAQTQLHYLDILDEQIQKIILWGGMLTIPARVNDWLATARPGYYIPFHQVFEDELPILDDRQRVLNYLAWAPKEIQGGVVDAANGLIYCYAKNARDRLKSIWLLIAGFIVATLLVIGACFVPASQWPIQSQNLSAMLVGWGAVLIGIVTHIGIGSVKRSQSQGGLPPILAVGDLPLIIDARIGQIMLKLLLALIGFFGLAFASGIDNLSPLNAFLVGYTLDSFVELFGAKLDQQASAQLSTVKSQLGVTGK